MEITAPRDSAAHRALLELARKDGRALLKAFMEMLWLINAHWELRAFLLVAENLREVLRLFERKWPGQLTEWRLESWLPALDWALAPERRQILVESVGKQIQDGFSENRHHPILGEGAERHALYTAFCNSHPRPELLVAYQVLQGYLLIAHVEAMGRYTRYSDFRNYAGKLGILNRRANPTLAMRAVRYLSKADPIPESILESLSLLGTVPEFVVALRKVRPPSKTNANRLNAVSRFLNKALGLKKQQGGGGGNRRGGSRRIHGGSASDSLIQQTSVMGGDPGDHGSHSISTKSSKSAAKRRALLDIDEYPNLEDDDDPLVASEYPDDDENPGKNASAAASESRYFELAHQSFPWEYGALAPLETVPITVDSMRIFKNVSSPSELSNADQLELEFHALLQTMFWLQTDIKHAKELRMYRFESTAAALSIIPNTSDGIPRWRIDAALPTYAPQPAAPEGIDRLRSQYVELPDTVGASQLIRLLIDLRKLDRGSEMEVKRPQSRIFRLPEEWYRERFKTWRKQNDPTGRLTEGRIANCLTHRLLASSGGDVVAVSIIRGRELALAKSRLFYACPSEERLQRLYCETAESMLGDAERAAEVEPSSPTPRCTVSKYYIGNRINPTLEAVRSAVRNLKRDLKRWYRASTDEELRIYHNAYTFWTTWAFQFATSWRGTATPYLALSKIDPETGAYVSGDKDSGSGYHHRLGWLLAEMIQQMKFYEEFLAQSPFRAKADPSWPCFYVNKKFRPVEVRPSTSKPIMEQYLPLAPNIHRRFTASALLELGPSVVEFECLWSGHWFRGEEPWAPMSTYSFAKHRKLLEQILFPFWRQLGFRAIKPFSDFKV